MLKSTSLQRVTVFLCSFSYMFPVFSLPLIRLWSFLFSSVMIIILQKDFLLRNHWTFSQMLIKSHNIACRIGANIYDTCILRAAFLYIASVITLFHPCFHSLVQNGQSYWGWEFIQFYLWLVFKLRKASISVSCSSAFQRFRMKSDEGISYEKLHIFESILEKVSSRF